MNLETQLCTLDQAKALHALGIKQVSLFYYIPWKAKEWNGTFIGMKCNKGFFHVLDGEAETFSAGDEVYSAFGVTELGIILPPFFPTMVHDGYKSVHCENSRVDTFPLLCGQTPHDETPAHVFNRELIPPIAARWEAEARAAMALFLIENSYLTVEDANKRLAIIAP